MFDKTENSKNILLIYTNENLSLYEDYPTEWNPWSQ